MPEVPGLDVTALTAWLTATHPEIDVPAALHAAVIAGGRSNLTYSVDGAAIPLILRRPPLGHVLSSAHDMGREHRVISALAGTPIPVPVAIDIVDDTDGTITGTPFFLMKRAPGRVLSSRTQNSEYTASGLHQLSIRLVEHLADLHAVDPAAVGLGDFGRPDGYLTRQLSTWRRQLDASRSRETPNLDRLQDSLVQDIPQTSWSGIVHGDYRLDNALVDGPSDHPRISAILDWEMATLGDPLVDLGIFALYWDLADLPGGGSAVPSAVDQNAGYPSFDELADAYAAHAGIVLPSLNWYRAFAAYKLAVILEGIHYRYRAGDTVGDGFERMGGLVEPLAQKGLRVH
ncbi:phosphotransferase family protein [Microbacterium sp. A196]|uniref:phosphotransferase family protein n=1 Tax=Microbacterium sp. A196 TaxID=3457320 RepID=UPI003FD497C7